MTPPNGLDRRALLTVAAMSPLAAVPMPEGAGIIPLRAQAAHILRHGESARAIGLAYLESTSPQVASALVARVARRMGAIKTHNALAAATSMSIRADYALSRTVSVRGWVISETEAGFCILRTMASSDEMA